MMDSNAYILLGCGGHARVLLDACLAAGHPEPLAILDRDSTSWGQKLLGVAIAGGDELLPELIERGAEEALVGIGSVGDDAVRRRLVAQCNRTGLRLKSVIHPSAIVGREVELGNGVQLLAGVIVNSGTRVGAHAILNTSCLVEHDCSIGEFCHIAPGAKLGGNVVVGDGAHVGIGACVKQGVRIGDHAVIGAGAVVVGDIPPRVVAVGVPARIQRRLAA